MNVRWMFPAGPWLLSPHEQLGTESFRSLELSDPALARAMVAVVAPWLRSAVKSAAQLLPFVPSPGLTLKFGPLRADSDVQVVPPFGVSCRYSVPAANVLFGFVVWALKLANVLDPAATETSPITQRSIRYCFARFLDIFAPSWGSCFLCTAAPQPCAC